MRPGTTLALLLTCACTSSETASPADDPRPSVEPAPSTKTEPSRQPEPVATSEPPPVAIAAQPTVAPLGRDHRSFVPCTADRDCGWDDACMPTRCVEAGKDVAACDESAPPPGRCGCIEGACTLRPKQPPPPTGPCEVRGCMVDRGAGRCVADTAGVAENLRTTIPLNAGPSCDCERPAEGCTFTWFDAVPCETDRDCWIDPSPRRHPIPRPKALRKRDFKPCADGEAAPKCSPAGQCIVGPAFSC